MDAQPFATNQGDLAGLLDQNAGKISGHLPNKMGNGAI